ncbi:MAG: PHP domain-containing protein [Promethearchaeota archaeon]
MKTRSKVLIVSLMLVLFILPVLMSKDPVVLQNNETPEKVTNVSQTGHMVLFDEAHCAHGSSMFTPGNASLFAWILEEHGYETDMNFNQQLDSGILTGVDMLVLFFPMVALTAGEVTAVQNFVQAGGGLLLVGVENNAVWGYSSTNLNALSQTYGVTFSTTESWNGIAQDMVAHQVTQDVSSIHSNVDYKFTGTTLSVSGSAQTVITFDGNPVVAVSEAGAGRVVCVGTPAPFLMYRRLTTWQVEKDDLFQFSLNIADWLVGISPRKVNVPAVAVIPVGTGPSLSPAELESYGSYMGIIHDHTTHSDGSDTPANMLWAGVQRGLDFMVMTDHSYEAPSPLGLGGITGALAMRSIAESNGLDIEIFVGAELSRGHHSLAFPLTSNIYTNTQAGMVAGAHAQGAIISLCHPTISAEYIPTYEAFDSLGYDAIEVDNTGFYHGLFDEGFSRPFYGASDGHSYEWVGTIVNVVFVNHPTGPDGRLSAMDVANAILARRVVIVDKASNLVYGQQVWLDRYFELMNQTETDIADAEAIVDTGNSNQTNLAALYLEDAKIAYSHSSFQRAIYAAGNASAAEASNIQFNVVAPYPRFIQPNTLYNLTLNVTNDNSDAIHLNMSRYRSQGLTSNFTGQIIEIPGNGFTIIETSFKTPLEGYNALVFNLQGFNTTANLSPLIYGVGAITNVGSHSPEIERTVDGTYLTYIYPIARGDSRYLRSVRGFYNNGTGWLNGTASIRTVTIEGTIGPYLRGTELDIYFIAYDMFGGVFVSPTVHYTITTDPLEPTSTTTSGTGPFVLDPLVLGITAGGIIAVVIIVVVLKKKR